MNKSHSNALLLLIALFFSVPVIAGPYLGVEIGNNRADLVLDADRAAVAENAATFGTLASLTESGTDSDSGLGLILGYSFERAAIELSWADLGAYTQTLTATGTTTGGDPMQIVRRVDSETTALALKASYDFPVTAQTAWFVQAGIARWKRDTTIVDSGTEFPPPPASPNNLFRATETRSERETDMVGGIGFRIGAPGNGLSVLYSRYFNAAHGGDDISRVSVAMSFGL